MFKFNLGQDVVVESSRNRPHFMLPGEVIAEPLTGKITWQANIAELDPQTQEVTNVKASYGVFLTDDAKRTQEVEFWETDLVSSE